MNTKVEFPIALKEKLLELAIRVPEAARSRFVQETTKRISEAAADHPRTLIFAAAGWVLGEIIDHILTVHVPFSQVVLHLTADSASEVGGVAGAFYGFFQDRNSKAERRQIARIIGEELRKAIPADTSPQ